MLNSNIKFAIRNLLKNKLNSIINIVGLSLGITATLFILTYIANEYSYEDYQKNKENIYRLSVIWGKDHTASLSTGAQYPLAPALKNSIPEIEYYTRVRMTGNSERNLEINGEKFRNNEVYFIDPDFDKVFTYEFYEGFDREKFREPFKVLISKTFSERHRINKNSSLLIGENNYQVEGVFNDVPLNSHFRPEVLISYKTLESVYSQNYLSWNRWGEDFTYILTKPKTDKIQLKKKADELVAKNANSYIADQMSYDVHSLREIHWRNDFTYDLGTKGNMIFIYIFTAAAIIILILACFNYVNLTTAYALERMKEVGIKKVIGAQRKQLVLQFMFEALLITFFSAFIGIVLFEISYKYLFEYINVSIVMQESFVGLLMLFVITLILIPGIVAGLFPAVYMSKFKPIDTIRGTKGTGASKQILRRVIVTAQFGVTIFLLFGTIVIFQQINFLKNADIGISKDNMAVISLWENDKDYRDKFSLLKSELLKNSNIKGVSAAYTLPGVRSRMTIGTYPANDPENKKNVRGMPVDFSFISVMNLKLLKGRDFNEKISDDLDQKSIIVNEAFVKLFNLKNPVGSLFATEKTIIGVVKDMHVESLQKKIEPLMFYVKPDMYKVATVKLAESSFEEGITGIKNTWSKLFPGTQPDFAFLDQIYRKLYKDEEKTAVLLSIFSALAIFISCIGLFGLTVFINNKRSKEIGVRKVLGASTSGITFMLTKEFAYWVIFSGIITLPIGLILMKDWLNNFAYKIEIGFLPFIYSIGLVLLLAVLTISTKSIKAACANPVDSLRDE